MLKKRGRSNDRPSPRLPIQAVTPSYRQPAQSSSAGKPHSRANFSAAESVLGCQEHCAVRVAKVPQILAIMRDPFSGPPSGRSVANMPHSAESASHANIRPTLLPSWGASQMTAAAASTGMLAADCSLLVTSRLMMQSKFRHESRPANLHIRCGLIVALAAGLALGACASSSPSSSPPPSASSSPDMPKLYDAPPPTGLGQRELTPAEKKIIANAIAPSLRDAAMAQYRWPKMQSVPDGPVNATINPHFMCRVAGRNSCLSLLCIVSLDVTKEQSAASFPIDEGRSRHLRRGPGE